MDYIFKSNRLGFRSFQESDTDVLFRNHNEEGLKQWIPNESYADMKETFNAISFFKDCVNKETLPYVLAIELLETSELIGDIGINEVDGKSDEIEIGFSICEKHQGFGYATESVIAMSEFIVSKFPIKIMYGRVMNGNEASCRVMERSGYQYQITEFGAEDDPYKKGMLIFKRLL